MERLRPALSEADLENAVFRLLIGRSRILHHVKPGNAYAPANKDDLHELVQNTGRSGLVCRSMAAGFEAHSVDTGIYDRLTDNGRDLVGEAFALRDVNRLETHLLGVGQAFLIPIANNDDGRAQHLGRSRSRHTYWTCARHIDRRSDADSCRRGSVEACGKNV